MQWQSIKTFEELEELNNRSESEPIIIFKHSTKCGISHHAKHRLESQLEELTIDNVNIYLLDLLSFREISNEISRKYSVVHQSPQVLIISKGKSIFNTSHHKINAKILLDNLPNG